MGNQFQKIVDTLRQKIKVSRYESDRVVYFVSNSGRELSDRCHLFVLDYLHLQAFKLCFAANQLFISCFQIGLVFCRIDQKASTFERPADRQEKDIVIVRLYQIVEGTKPNGIEGPLRAVYARYNR